MKKHLIAAAVAAAVAVPAMAQDVQLYGILGAAYTNTSIEASNGRTLKDKNTGSTRGEQSGNRIGFRGTEDLGNGLKAGFTYELNANMDTGLGTTRLAFAQLQGGFGTVRAGKVDSLTRQIFNGFTAHGNTNFAPGNSGQLVGAASGQIYSAIYGTADPRGCGSFSTSLSGGALEEGAERFNFAEECAALGQMQSFGGTRVNNSIGYISPNISGFTFQAQYGRQTQDRSWSSGTGRGSLADNTTNAANTVNVGVSYAAGPLAISVAQDKAKFSLPFSTSGENNPLEGKSTTNMLGASYDLGVAKLFGVYTDKKNDFELVDDGDIFDTKIKDLTIGVQVPLGAWTFVASLSDGSHKIDIDGDKYTDDTSAYQLQANYAMSKRTKLYAMYGQSKYKTDSDWEVNDAKIKGFALGIQHNF